MSQFKIDISVGFQKYMSRPARRPTLWPLRNVSAQISLRNPRRLIRADTFRLRGIDV